MTVNAKNSDNKTPSDVAQDVKVRYLLKKNYVGISEKIAKQGIFNRTRSHKHHVDEQAHSSGIGRKNKRRKIK